MEEQNILNPDDEVHLAILHRIYVPRINHALLEFEQEWAFHPLSSSNNRSPRQLWFMGMQNLISNDPNSLEEAQIGGWNEYGIDEEAPIPDINTNNNIVPRSFVRFCELHEREFWQLINPLSNDENEGINLYTQALSLCDNYLANHCCILERS